MAEPDHAGAVGAAPTRRLADELYGRLRRLAARYVQGERPGALSPTELVHEAYLRLDGMNRMAWAGKTHFMAVAALQMRRVLVDAARAARAAKRAGRPITLCDGVIGESTNVVEILALESAIDSLAERSARQARVAILRIYGGLLVGEVAQVLGVSSRTVKRDWQVARAWIARGLDAAPPAG